MEDPFLLSRLRQLLDEARAGIRRRREKVRPAKQRRQIGLDRDDEHYCKAMTEQPTNDLFLGARGVDDYAVNSILMERARLKLETFQKSITLASSNRWDDYISEHFRVQYSHTDTGLAIEDQTSSYIYFDMSGGTINIRIVGNQSFVANWYQQLTKHFDEITNVIEWMYSGDGHSVEIPLRNDRTPVDEMYPWLNGQTLADYYDSFINSSASILLLIGPPGTGKTTFIRGMLQHAKKSAVVTYDPAILAKDYVFAQFVEGDRSFMVIEDADNFLSARANGNDMMHKFLNVGDGLVTITNKKMIFTTNLPSIKDVDSALIRPGRCFDIIKFDHMNQQQAQALADKVGVTLDSKRDKWTLADVFHKQVERRPVTGKVGFV